jgi:hypothetical protein
MQNRVGSLIPSAEDSQQLVKDFDTFVAKIDKYTLMLSAEERKRTTKMRVQGERIVDLIGTLATRHQVALPRISVGDMNADLLLAQRLAPLAARLSAVSQKVADTILQAQSECWWSAMAFYSALTRLSNVDAELEAALKPAIEFFARRARPDEPTVEA